MAADRYGQFYWMIETPTEIIHAHADSVKIEHGVLILMSTKAHGVNLAFAPGHWVSVGGASVMDGGRVCIEHREPNDGPQT